MMRRTANSSARRRAHDEGAALIFALLGLAALTALGIGITTVGIVATTVTVNERETARAFSIADAGIAHARRLILWQEWDSFDQFLQNVGGTACDADELAAAPAAPLPPGYPTAPADFIPQAGRAFGGGSYRVAVCDDHATDVDPVTGTLDTDPNVDVNKRMIIRSTGTDPSGATATVELVIGATDVPAVYVNGNLELSGNPTVSGPGGGVHANEDLEASGDPCALYYSASGSIPVSGSPNSGAACADPTLDTRPDSAPLIVPSLSAGQFKNQADYWLENNGDATDSSGNPIATPGWNHNNQGWRMQGVPNPGTYWIDDNVRVTSSPGSAASPIAITLLATLSIDISGNPNFVPALTVTDMALGPNPVSIAMIADTDLELSGNPSTSTEGLHYARHQLDISGNVTINGQVLALNEGDPSYPPGNKNLVTLQGGFMTISGNPTITFSGNGIAGTRPLTWRECRTIINPADPCGPLWGGN